MRVAVLIAMLALAALLALAGASTAQAKDGERATARRAYASWLHTFRTRPKRACRQHLTARARRQWDAGTQPPDCRSTSANIPYDPFFLRVKLGSAGRARALYAPKGTRVYCPADEPMVLVRTDRMVRRDGRWRIDRFGFGRLKCMPRSTFDR